MYRIPSSSTFLNGIIGRPIVLEGFSLGKIMLILSYNIWNLEYSILSFISSFWIQVTLAETATSYNSIEFWDMLLTYSK
jgi:hypothetical protein